MERRSFVKMLGAASLAAPAILTSRSASAQDKVTIALIPGLTADGFYVTMHHGAEAAAKAVGAELIYQGAAEWNVTLQVPILDAIIAKKPKAILIAPNDKTQMIQPLKKANDAGIAVVCVDTFIGTGVFQTGAGDADFPISYVASDNVLGGRMAARALAKAIGEKGKVYVSNVTPGVSTTDQREEGFKARWHYKGSKSWTQFNGDDANKAGQFRPFSPAALISRACSVPICFGRRRANGAKQAGVRQGEMAGFDGWIHRRSAEGWHVRATIASTPPIAI